MRHVKRSALALCLCLAQGSLSAADAADAVPSGETGRELVPEHAYNPWHFRIGPVMAPRVRARVQGPGAAVMAPRVPTAAKSGSYGTAPAAPSAGYVNRDYADGRVYPDEGTDDPGTAIAGLTWDWGAADVPSQYSDGRVSFHSDADRWTETYSVSSYSEGAESESDRDVLLGVEAMGGWTYFENETFDAAVDLGFRYYGSGDLSANQRYGTSVTATRDEYRIVDTYDASGWTTVPSGSYDGTAGGPGRLLGALPERSEELAGSYRSQSSYSSRSRSALDYTIWDLRLGPTLGWKPVEWFVLRGGVYGLLGLVDATLKTEAQRTDGAFSASHSRCTPIFGMAFGCSAEVHVTDWLFLYGAIEYDWWTDRVSLSDGGSHATLELSDYSVSAGLGFEF